MSATNTSQSSSNYDAQGLKPIQICPDGIVHHEQTYRARLLCETSHSHSMIRLQKFVPSAQLCVEAIPRSRDALVQMQMRFHDVQTLHRRHSRRDAAVAPGASVGFYALKSMLRWTASLSQRRAARNTAAKRRHGYVPKILSFIFQRNFRLQLVG
jgi:hypothetical protein